MEKSYAKSEEKQPPEVRFWGKLDLSRGGDHQPKATGIHCD